MALHSDETVTKYYQIYKKFTPRVLNTLSKKLKNEICTLRYWSALWISFILKKYQRVLLIFTFKILSRNIHIGWAEWVHVYKTRNIAQFGEKIIFSCSAQQTWLDRVGLKRKGAKKIYDCVLGYMDFATSQGEFDSKTKKTRDPKLSHS